MVRLPGWRPTPLQELLLQACLLDGRNAEVAFGHWNEQRGASPLDRGSERLLPLLWHRQGERVASMEPGSNPKSHYLRTWRDNQLLLSRSRAVLQALTRAAIPVMLLKGMALSFEAYRSLGVRPMADLDLAVPFQLVSQALNVLGREGWSASPTPLSGSGSAMASSLTWLEQPRPTRSFDLAYLITRHGHGFRKEDGQEIDLHWFLFQGQCDPGVDDRSWQAARPLQEPVRWGLEGPGDLLLIPSPADHLLLLLSHGARWNPVPSIRWIADAVTLMRAAPDLDWDWFLAETLRRRAILPVREMLGYLKESFELQLPAWVLSSLHKAPLTRRERLSYRLAVSPPGAGTAVAELRYLGRRHRRLRQDLCHGTPCAGFAQYVTHVLGAPGAKALAGYAGRELMRRWSLPLESNSVINS
jgi:hypothetical protein